MAIELSLGFTSPFSFPTMPHYPSTKSLRSFEAVARLGSIKAAADHLSVSASALSRRLQSLEEDLGQPLFKRNVQGLELTESGAFYAERLREIFKSLDDATAAMQRQARRRLTVVGPAVVIQPCLEEAHSIENFLPHVDLIFKTAAASSPSDPAFAEADIAFFWRKGDWAGWKTTPITHRAFIVPLCAPGLLQDGVPLSMEELAQQTWISIGAFEEAWEVWFNAMGISLPAPKRIVKVADAMAATLMAQKGGGIFIGTSFGGVPHLSVLQGYLAPAHAFHAFTPDYAVHLALRQNKEDPDTDRFASWFFHAVWNWDAARRRAGLSEK